MAFGHYLDILTIWVRFLFGLESPALEFHVLPDLRCWLGYRQYSSTFSSQKLAGFLFSINGLWPSGRIIQNICNTEPILLCSFHVLEAEEKPRRVIARVPFASLKLQRDRSGEFRRALDALDERMQGLIGRRRNSHRLAVLDHRAT